MDQEKNLDKKLWHVVLISFRPEVGEEVRKTIYERCQTLARECGGSDEGILQWVVDWNLDTRKNMHLVEIACFENNEALQAFRRHPKHAAFTDTLREIADWVVGDIYVDSRQGF